ncbi:13945_t:CDS:2 [Dentiscutata heterogama]|uniref:13945_t:CDS:1 n=1 Tax=Dentiscutata heterogama TaxID=1316150 RepID=A0ACA9KCX4_9GLOM|nr:13945_t:CDS:2 [Dentiscutata heterogama]
MGGSDSTKPIYYGHNDEDVEEEKVELQCSETYNYAKNWALKVEKYNKDNEYEPFKNTTNESNNTDQDNQMSKMESRIKKLTKAIISLKENKLPNARCNQRMNNATQDQNINNQNQINDIVKGKSDEYLMIKAKDGESLFDVRNEVK